MQARTLRPTLFSFLAAAALFVAATFATATASADVLVLQDGSRITTAGPFEVDGERVTFTDAQGRFAALPLDEVDLEASRAATDEASRPRSNVATETSPMKRKSEEKPEPVMTLTNADVGTASDETGGEMAADDEPQIILYTTSWCGYCRKARSLLDELEVDYVEHDIEKDVKAYTEKSRKSPSCGVPVTDIGGTVVCGFNEPRMRKLIDALPADSAPGAEATDSEGTAS